MKERVNTNNAPAAIGPYSQAVKHGRMLVTSGQIPLDPVSGPAGPRVAVERLPKDVLVEVEAIAFI